MSLSDYLSPNRALFGNAVAAFVLSSMDPRVLFATSCRSANVNQSPRGCCFAGNAALLTFCCDCAGFVPVATTAQVLKIVTLGEFLLVFQPVDASGI